MPRGGKRPGTGAPFGNTNALRHGQRSPRVIAVVRAIWNVPEVRRLFLTIIRKQSKSSAIFPNLTRSEEAQIKAKLDRILAINQNKGRCPEPAEGG